MRGFLNRVSTHRARVVTRGLGRTAFMLTFVLSMSMSMSMAQSTAQQGLPPENTGRFATGATATAMDKALENIDVLLEQLDTHIDAAWARAKEMLSLAAATRNLDQRMQLEVLHERMVGVARSLEEQSAHLRALQRELAADQELP